MFLTADRLPHVEFLAVTLEVKLGFIFRAPPLSYVSNIYYLPFNTVVWICSIVLVVVCTALTYIVYKFSKEDSKNLTTSDFFLFGISNVCQMGSQLIPKTAAGKITTVNITVDILFPLFSSFIYLNFSSFFV